MAALPKATAEATGLTFGALRPPSPAVREEAGSPEPVGLKRVPQHVQGGDALVSGDSHPGPRPPGLGSPFLHGRCWGCPASASWSRPPWDRLSEHWDAELSARSPPSSGPSGGSFASRFRAPFKHPLGIPALVYKTYPGKATVTLTFP